MKIASSMLALVLCASPAFAQQTTDQKQSEPSTTTSSAKKEGAKQGATSTATERSAPEVMKLTQQAITHIDAAARALEQNKTAAAKSSLAKSKQVLDKLYKTSVTTALLNEFDEIINSITGKGPSLKPLDLQPLRATVSTYQAYVDPEVMAGIDTAQQRADKGDMKGSEEALRLARNRVAVDMSFLPVEEAYTRVLAAQQALQSGDKKTALALIRNVPIVVSELQLSRPLLPIRVELQAAAEAAEAKQWDRARSLLKSANQQAQSLTSIAVSSDVNDELTPIADDIQKLSRQAQAGTNPQPKQIRDLVERTRSIGEENETSDQG